MYDQQFRELRLFQITILEFQFSIFYKLFYLTCTEQLGNNEFEKTSLKIFVRKLQKIHICIHLFFDKNLD